MSKALKTRLAALETYFSPDDGSRPKAIFIMRSSGRTGEPHPDHLIIGLSGGDVTLLRLPGETMPELQARAEAYPPHVPGGVRCWISQYKDDENE